MKRRSFILFALLVAYFGEGYQQVVALVFTLFILSIGVSSNLLVWVLKYVFQILCFDSLLLDFIAFQTQKPKKKKRKKINLAYCFPFGLSLCLPDTLFLLLRVNYFSVHTKTETKKQKEKKRQNIRSGKSCFILFAFLVAYFGRGLSSGCGFSTYSLHFKYWSFLSNKQGTTGAHLFLFPQLFFYFCFLVHSLSYLWKTLICFWKKRKIFFRKFNH